MQLVLHRPFELLPTRRARRECVRVRGRCIGARLTLAQGDLFSLSTQKPIAILGGQVWITQEGDPTDYVLGPGETFHPRSAGTIVLQAMDAAEVILGEDDRLREAAGV